MQGYDKPKSRNMSSNSGMTKDTKVNVGGSKSSYASCNIKSGSGMKAPKGFDSGIVEGKIA